MNKNIEYINHKPNMSIDFFCKNCINCKYREIGGSFDMNTVSGRCSYPYKGKCSKRNNLIQIWTVACILFIDSWIIGDVCFDV